MTDSLPDALSAQPGTTHTHLSTLGQTVANLEIRDCHFVQCRFTSSHFTDVDFIDCTFDGCDFNSTSCANVTFLRCTHNRTSFYEAQLLGVRFVDSTLDRVDFGNAQAEGTNFSRSAIRSCAFSRTRLARASFQEASLDHFTFVSCDLHHGSFLDARLKYVTFADCWLSSVDFSGSGAFGSPSELLAKYFRRTDDGYLGYKTFGYLRTPPDHWRIEPGAVLTETPNPDITSDCGSGINIATPEWLDEENAIDPDLEFWELLIPWEALADVVVPRPFGGKIRTGRAILQRPISAEELEAILAERRRATAS